MHNLERTIILLDMFTRHAMNLEANIHLLVMWAVLGGLNERPYEQSEMNWEWFCGFCDYNVTQRLHDFVFMKVEWVQNDAMWLRLTLQERLHISSFFGMNSGDDAASRDRAMNTLTEICSKRYAVLDVQTQIDLVYWMRIHISDASDSLRIGRSCNVHGFPKTAVRW